MQCFSELFHTDRLTIDARGNRWGKINGNKIENENEKVEDNKFLGKLIEIKESKMSGEICSICQYVLLIMMILINSYDTC